MLTEPPHDVEHGAHAQWGAQQKHLQSGYSHHAWERCRGAGGDGGRRRQQEPLLEDRTGTRRGAVSSVRAPPRGPGGPSVFCAVTLHVLILPQQQYHEDEGLTGAGLGTG